MWAKFLFFLCFFLPEIFCFDNQLLRTSFVPFQLLSNPFDSEAGLKNVLESLERQGSSPQQAFVERLIHPTVLDSLNPFNDLPEKLQIIIDSHGKSFTVSLQNEYDRRKQSDKSFGFESILISLPGKEDASRFVISRNERIRTRRCQFHGNITDIVDSARTSGDLQIDLDAVNRFGVVELNVCDIIDGSITLETLDQNRLKLNFRSAKLRTPTGVMFFASVSTPLTDRNTPSLVGSETLKIPSSSKHVTSEQDIVAIIKRKLASRAPITVDGKSYELGLVLDQSFVEKCSGGNVNVAIANAHLIVQKVADIFKQVDMDVNPKGFIIFTDNNPQPWQPIPVDLRSDLLRNIRSWQASIKITDYLDEEVDGVQVLTCNPITGAISYEDSVCSDFGGLGVSRYYNIDLTAVLMAQQIAHTVGLKKISNESLATECSNLEGCTSSRCLMSDLVSAQATEFSACSRELFRKASLSKGCIEAVMCPKVLFSVETINKVYFACETLNSLVLKVNQTDLPVNYELNGPRLFSIHATEGDIYYNGLAPIAAQGQDVSSAVLKITATLNIGNLECKQEETVMMTLMCPCPQKFIEPTALSGSLLTCDTEELVEVISPQNTTLHPSVMDPKYSLSNLNGFSVSPADGTVFFGGPNAVAPSFQNHALYQTTLQIETTSVMNEEVTCKGEIDISLRVSCSGSDFVPAPVRSTRMMVDITEPATTRRTSPPTISTTTEKPVTTSTTTTTSTPETTTTTTTSTTTAPESRQNLNRERRANCPDKLFQVVTTVRTITQQCPTTFTSRVVLGGGEVEPMPGALLRFSLAPSSDSRFEIDNASGELRFTGLFETDAVAIIVGSGDYQDPVSKASASNCSSRSVLSLFLRCREDRPTVGQGDILTKFMGLLGG